MLTNAVDKWFYFDNIGNMENKDVIDALAALAQETRLAIFRLLVEAGPDGLPVGTIAETLDLANATLSFHLKELTRAGLTTATPNGRSILYSARFDTMNGLIGYLTENCCAGSDSLSASTCAPGCAPACAPARTVTATPGSTAASKQRRAKNSANKTAIKPKLPGTQARRKKP
jgi:DNA-binding transcriptional ArsR family regulator